MTNREVYKEVEERIAPYYPKYNDSEELRDVINRAVDMVKFELDIPQGMAVQYVRKLVYAYKPKVEGNDND